MNSAEIWKPVVGFEGYYEVSNRGRVRSLDRTVVMKDGKKRFTRGKMLKPVVYNGKRHYHGVVLSKEGYHKRHSIHRLVAQAFIPNQDNLPEINHKDEDKTNNCVENLEWCDRKYNNAYGTAKIRAAVTQGKPVLQLKDGRIINAWPTEGLAAQFTGATQGGISGCCRGEYQTSGGYGWMWAPWTGQ